VLYYVLCSARIRRTSRDYLRRTALAPNLANIYRHLLHFAQTNLDRLYFLSGDCSPFQVTCTGHHHLVTASNEGRGAIVLGAHLGSFESMRAMSQVQTLKLVAVGYFKNAKKINAVLDHYGENSARLVHVEPGTVGYMLKLKELLDAGYLVALLGDRDIGGPTCQVELLGGEVSLPVGPYALASQMQCPILVTFGLFSQPNRYELFCEPLGQIDRVERKERSRVFQQAAQRYANLVEKYCHQYPLNWFNFYDYWNTSHARDKS
jgi:predicted LPLAT superfamily acyltransferase